MAGPWVILLVVDDEQDAIATHDDLERSDRTVTMYEACGIDFMAGQICIKPTDHDGGHD